jgi:kinesin family protein 6/9
VSLPDVDKNAQTIQFCHLADRQDKNTYVNNTKNSQTFAFSKILDESVTQDDVFEGICKDMVDSALDGYNGTLFAYGQTGSGKTYTMTGGAERYADRGIIPRAISRLFGCIRSRTNQSVNVMVSYLEIYNSDGYDLLSAGSSISEQRNLDDLQKVSPHENAEGELVLRNLSIHKAEKEEDMLNILFIGDTNRIVCETPMNDVSTRSHCIFTIYLETKEIGSEVKRLSKLHLVDLSGSERVGKIGLDGRLLKEACYINLSLHYLEHVIVCLQKKMKGEKIFVPYRNCLMTMVLKDSLGGNCKTRMVATIYPKDENINESISTCHFAQRVAMIKNSNKRNEVIDPDVVIARLKRENEELKSEIRVLKGDNYKEQLTRDEEKLCEDFIDNYITDKENSRPFILVDKLMFSHGLAYFRNKFWRLKEEADNAQNLNSVNKNSLVKESNHLTETQEAKKKEIPIAVSKGPDQSEVIDKLNREVSKLRTLLQQRDHEIAILLKMMDKRQTEDSGSSDNKPTMEIPLTFDKFEREACKIEEASKSLLKKSDDQSISKSTMISLAQNNSAQNSTKENPRLQKNNFTNDSQAEPDPFARLFVRELRVTPKELLNQKLCFELFRKHYKATHDIEQDLLTLKGIFEDAKSLSTTVKSAKQKIEDIKQELDIQRRKQEVRRITEAYTGDWIPSAEEKQLQSQMASYRESYLLNFEKLKNIKAEIVRMQNDIDRRRFSMQSDFEKWLKYNYETHKIKLTDQNTNPNSIKDDREDLSTQLNSNKDSFVSVSMANLPNASRVSNPNTRSQIDEFNKARNEAFKALLRK